jgi:molybdopterin synthase catalytic subunit
VIRVTADDFDPGTEIARLTADRTDAGGLCVFVGLVRDLAGEASLDALVLEHYPEMTERELARIDAEARRRWPLADTLIVHRYGRLAAGDRIVLVAALAAHRDAAFDACRFLVDWLKTRAPFWKREDAAGGRRWLAARDDDLARAAAWQDALGEAGGR